MEDSLTSNIEIEISERRFRVRAVASFLKIKLKIKIEKEKFIIKNFVWEQCLHNIKMKNKNRNKKSKYEKKKIENRYFWREVPKIAWVRAVASFLDIKIEKKDNKTFLKNIKIKVSEVRFLK